MMTDSIGIIPQ